MKSPGKWRTVDYSLYLQSDHWKHLKKIHITDNPRACCWICGRKNKLLLHHVSYDHLYHEKLNIDIYIVCFDCHTKIHFSFFGLCKTPLVKSKLIGRMRYIKYVYLSTLILTSIYKRFYT